MFIKLPCPALDGAHGITPNPTPAHPRSQFDSTPITSLAALKSYSTRYLSLRIMAVMLKRLMQRHLLLLAVAGLVGCAAPRYETATLREVPTEGSAQACLQGCEAHLNACKQTCAENYQACLKRVEPEAEAHYRQALDHYAAELEQYRRAMAVYEFQQWMHWNWARDPFWYTPWPYPYAIQPPPPRPPSREADMNRLREEQCGGDCGCQPPYDACFIGCGGKITREQRCVRNCPNTR